MDGQRFDDLTRLIGTGRSRRGVLRLIGGGLAAAVGLGGARQAGAQDKCLSEGSACFFDEECCDGFNCDGGFCAGCQSSGANCEFDEDCCGLLVCAGNVCAETCNVTDEPCGLGVDCCVGWFCNGLSVCEPTPFVCGEEGDLCKGDGTCCEGHFCNPEDARCKLIEPICTAEGEMCETDAECCAGICCGNACHAIECCIEDENPNDRCADGETCFEGICETPMCAVEGDSCASSAECCKDLACIDGTCQLDAVPNEEPDPEPVTHLPSTGVADDRSGLTGLMGAGLAAGAAALLAGKKLRSEQTTSTD